MFSIEKSRNLLRAAGVFFYDDPSELEGEDEKWLQALNMNDIWCWACADVEFVTDQELPEVAGLFWEYGWCGILYWVSEKNKGTDGPARSEFHDVNRQIEFVRNEEAIKAEIPGSSQRAYTKKSYTIGEI